MITIDSLKQAKAITGGIGHSSKMPWLTYGLSAFDCQTGARLAKIPGTPCASCYAMRDNYAYPTVRQAHLNRLKSLKDQNWVSAMVYQIRTASGKVGPTQHYFRWFDSGDIQSLDHLENIATIARKLPHIKFWLATQERGMVRHWKLTHKKPRNLIIRISSPKLGHIPHGRGLHSVVLPLKEYRVLNMIENTKVWLCPAHKQNHQCLECRACWNPKIKTVGYLAH
jgi:hypothetical protein